MTVLHSLNLFPCTCLLYAIPNCLLHSLFLPGPSPSFLRCRPRGGPHKGQPDPKHQREKSSPGGRAEVRPTQVRPEKQGGVGDPSERLGCCPDPLHFVDVSLNSPAHTCSSKQRRMC